MQPPTSTNIPVIIVKSTQNSTTQSAILTIGIQDMYGSNAKTTKWTTDTDLNNAIQLTDCHAENMAENIAVPPIIFHLMSQHSIKAHMVQNKQILYSAFKLDVNLILLTIISLNGYMKNGILVTIPALIILGHLVLQALYISLQQLHQLWSL
jgi:hypothetical protein